MVDDPFHGRSGARPGDLPHGEPYGGMPHDLGERYEMGGGIPHAGRTPAATESGLPPASQGMGYASPGGYQSPVSPGPTPEGRQAVREYESREGPRRMGAATVARTGERVGEPGGSTAWGRSTSRSKSSMTDMLRIGALVVGAVGALLLVVWLFATLSIQLAWPANLFITGLLLIGIAAGVLWASTKMGRGGGVLNRGGA